MAFQAISQAASSKTGHKIADLVSKRPRTLGELAGLTGVSVQAVLKHLKKLEKSGLVRGTTIESKAVRVRRVYYPGAVRLGDFSIGDLTVVKLSKPTRGRSRTSNPLEELELLAEESLVQRVRIGEQGRKLGRMIDGLVEDEGRMDALLEAIDLDEGERLILRVLFTEDTVEDAAKVLSSYYGLSDGRRSIDKVLAEARRSAKK